jgi:hypothetical protein
MSKGNMDFGDLVILKDDDQGGLAGIVCESITDEKAGHVLVLKDGNLHGITTSIDDVAPADESSKGFVQIAYNLIKLGSHVIENTLI